MLPNKITKKAFVPVEPGRRYVTHGSPPIKGFFDCGATHPDEVAIIRFSDRRLVTGLHSCVNDAPAEGDHVRKRLEGNRQVTCLAQAADP